MPKAISPHLPDLVRIDRHRPPAISSAFLRLLNPVPLALAPDVVLGLGDSAKDRHQELAYTAAGIHARLLKAAERYAGPADLLHQPVEVAYRAGEAIKASDDEVSPGRS